MNVKVIVNILVFAALAATHLFGAENTAHADPLMAEYDGFWTATTGAKGRMTAQIRPLGKNQYDGFVILTRARNTVTGFQLKKASAENGVLKLVGAATAPAGADLPGQ